MPITQDNINFFLNAPAALVQLELLELSHSAFSKTYRIVSNASEGVEFQAHAYTYYPCQIKPAFDFDNLEFKLDVQLGDLGEIIPKELQNIQISETQSEPVNVNYFILRSDNLITPMQSFLNLEAAVFTFTAEGSSFTAQAHGLNTYQTGETYNLKDYPYLKGFL